VKALICTNRILATLHRIECGVVVDVRNAECPLCDHENRYYDKIPISDEVWDKIEPYWLSKETIIYDHINEKIKLIRNKEVK
jgi:hypothetical protein